MSKAISTLHEEISVAREQLVALIEEQTFELWESDLESDLLGLSLKMAEWVRLCAQAQREAAQ